MLLQYRHILFHVAKIQRFSLYCSFMPYLLTYFTFYFPHVGIFVPQLENFIFQVREQKKAGTHLEREHPQAASIVSTYRSITLYRISLPPQYTPLGIALLSVP